MPRPGPRPLPLHVHLAKAGVAPAERVLRDPGALQVHQVGDPPGSLGALYVESPDLATPAWAATFTGHAHPALPQLLAGHAAAVWLLTVDGRVFAITFGSGRFLLRDDVLEERFGLRAALNAIDPQRLQFIEKTALDTYGTHARVQASRATQPRDFGFNVERDLLRAIAGPSRDVALGARVAGHDSLSLSPRILLTGVPGLLSRVLALSQDRGYVREMPWVEHVAAVREASLISELDGLLVSQLRVDDPERLWMAVPEVLPTLRPLLFKYTASAREEAQVDIDLADFLRTRRHRSTPMTPAELRARRVTCIDDEGSPIEGWQAYKCFYAEVDLRGEGYVLSAGHWYRVARAYVADLDTYVAQIPEAALALPDYSDRTETEYNARVAREQPERFALMDAKNIVLPSEPGAVEFCDLYSSTRQIIHVKRYGHAPVLSHLFHQGVVSGDLFRGESRFRTEVESRLQGAFKFPDPLAPPRQDEYEVIFAIISRKPRPLRLPIFGRVALRAAARQLQGYGYRVARATIGCA